MKPTERLISISSTEESRDKGSAKNGNFRVHALLRGSSVHITMSVTRGSFYGQVPVYNKIILPTTQCIPSSVFGGSNSLADNSSGRMGIQLSPKISKSSLNLFSQKLF